MRRSLLAALLALVTAAPLAAQIVRPAERSRDPRWIGSLGLGLADPNRIEDGETEAFWYFDSGLAFRASLERALRNEASVGIVATYGRFPLTYRRFAPILDDFVCGNQCEADADVVTAHALFHVGGGLGLHQVIELQAGITNYRNFQTSGGETLAPDSETDGSFAAAYGVGFGFSRTLSISLVQEFGAGYHGRDDRAPGAATWTRSNVIRAALRYGVGTLPRL
jgi:hypothetical protein